MFLHIIRILFILLCSAIVGVYSVDLMTPTGEGDEAPWTYGNAVVAVLITMFTCGLLVLFDLLTPKKKLSALSGLLIGLMAGMVAAYALGFIVDFVKAVFPFPDDVANGVKLLIGLICVFLSVTFVMQTKDDFRFIIPYIEFAKQVRGTRPMVLDTSAIIDGRILDVGATHILQGLLLVPRIVLQELQAIADSADKIKRVRGRRGLDILSKLQADPSLQITIDDSDPEGATVDQQLISLSQDQHARLMTTDFNLTKIARLRGVDVININELAEAMRPVFLPGEPLSVKIVKPGESPNQGVGYLEDGTMVVVEHARDRIGQDVALSVTSSLQTSAGRMIFGKLAGEHNERNTHETSPRSH